MQGEQTKQGAGSGGPDRLTAVKARIDELGKISQQLDAARTASKRTRLGIVIVILLIFIGFGWVWYSAVANFDKPAFVTEVHTLMLNPESGTLKEVIDVGKSMLPVYQKELQKQFGAEWPNIRKQLDAEGARLLKDVPAKAEAKIKDKLEAIAKAQEQVLLKEFPELKDPAAYDIVLKNLEAALQDAVLDVFQRRMAKAEDRLSVVHEKILKLLPPNDSQSFQLRMSNAWDQFLLDDLKGRQQIAP